MALSAFAERPNILVILTDDMGYSDLGCYGGEIETPNLDRLAANGLRFTSMYNTSKCWTTRISLLTGLYHQRSDRDFSNTALAGEVLRPAGYKTWWVGKHHADFNPYHRGFDHFSGFLGGAINFWNPGSQARPGEPTPGWGADYTWAFDEEEVQPYHPDKSFYATDAFTDWAIEWLEEAGDQPDPFFLFVAYNSPHWPLHAHPKDIEKYRGVYDVGYDAIRQARYKRQLELGIYQAETTPLSPAEHVAWDSLSPQQKEEEALRMQIHAGMVDNVDQNIGRLLTKLEEQNKLNDTLILFLTDNGASHEGQISRGTRHEDQVWGTVGSHQAIARNWANVANTPLRLWKVSGREGGINTPMIAHWPNGISAPSGSIERTPCHLIDFLPTFITLAKAGSHYPDNIAPVDGIDLSPLFAGTPLDRPSPLFHQYGAWQSMRDGEWKLIQNKNNDWELYNLEKDRTELENLAAQHPERVESMKKQGYSWFEEATGKTWKGELK